MEEKIQPHVYPEGCYFKTFEDIRDKHVTIMGLGLNGGGEACVRFFLQHGAYVTVTDMKTREELEPTILALSVDQYLDRSRLRYVLGKHCIEDFEQADCVIKNPGIKYEGNKYLAAAKNIETDISIFLHFTKAPIIAITGSKGKSSTASALYYGLQKSGFSPFLGGNITVSPLTFLDETDGTTPVVLELSSWQLRDLRGRKALKPKIAIITKIMRDHQNWYGDMDSYVNDKRLVYADQTASDYTILDADDDDYFNECSEKKKGCHCWGDDFAAETCGTVFRYSQYVMPKTVFGAFLKKEHDGQIYGYSALPPELRSKRAIMHNLREERIMKALAVPGPIMRINVLKAALALQLMGTAPEQISSVLADWPGLAHRLEMCHTWKSPADGRNVVFYNDSCSTVPEATVAATEAFRHNYVLITGGTDKNLDFLPLVRILSGETETKYKAKQIYLLKGTGTDKLTFLRDARHVNYYGPFDSISDLLLELRTNLSAPDTRTVYGPVTARTALPVVFSPGCTSFGMFMNEFDRGDKYKRSVKELFI